MKAAAPGIAVIAFLCAAALSWAGGTEQFAYEMPEQAVMSGIGASAPWWITLVIVGAPGIAAVTLTIATTTMIRRINRAAGQPPLNVWASIKLTLGVGAVWGALMSWGLGELVYALTNIVQNWKLIVIAPCITGLASMVAYDVLRWYTHQRHPGLYALLSVKHYAAAGHAGGNGDDGDLTRMASRDENDDTIPRG